MSSSSWNSPSLSPVVVAACTRGRGEREEAHAPRRRRKLASDFDCQSVVENATQLGKDDFRGRGVAARQKFGAEQAVVDVGVFSPIFFPIFETNSERERAPEAGAPLCFSSACQFSSPDARDGLSLCRCSSGSSSSSSCGPEQRRSCKQQRRRRQCPIGQRRSDGRRRRGACRVARGADSRERTGAARPEQVRCEREQERGRERRRRKPSL